MGLWSNIKDKSTLTMTRIKNFLTGKKENLQLMAGSDENLQLDKGNDFMSKYPTEKSLEELEYEKQNPSYFYQINDKKYKMNDLVMIRLKKYIAENQIPLKQIFSNQYLMARDEMDGMQKNNLLNVIIDTYYDGVGGAFFVEQGGSDWEKYIELCKVAEMKQWLSKQHCQNGKMDEANRLLEEEFVKIFEFREKILEEGRNF